MTYALREVLDEPYLRGVFAKAIRDYFLKRRGITIKLSDSGQIADDVIASLTREVP